MIGKIILHIAFVPTVNSWWFLGSTATGKFSILYSHLCLETVFLALKLTQDCYIHYNINIFLENWQCNHKLTPPL